MDSVRSGTTGYDSCDSEVAEIITACRAIDAAIAGFVDRRLHVSWAWDKEEDLDSIVIDWGLESASTAQDFDDSKERI